MVRTSALRAGLGHLTPTIHTLTGGDSLRGWLIRNGALEKLLTQGFAELPVNPEFLEHYAPKVYYGLVGPTGIVLDEQAARFRTKRRRDDELGEDMESGLMRRQDDEHKNQFHYHADLKDWLEEQGAPVNKYGTFWQSCNALDHAAWLIGCQLGLLFDAAHAGRTSLSREIEEGLRITRVLDYLPNRAVPNAPDAKVHYDRGTLTVHWESTEPGLVIFDRPGKPHRLNETDRSTVLLFWGRKFGLRYEELTGIVGTVHGVRDQGRTTRGGINRRAIVSFVHGALPPEAVERYHANKPHYVAFPAKYPL